MQSATRSYKRWQCGEEHQKALQVLKHFFPSETMKTGLNQKQRVDMLSVAEAAIKAVSLKKSDDDPRSFVLALKCTLSKEQ